jgi:hypothetical protein
LLDEPETSLHPGAQDRLVIFLMEEALKNKHQVVFTTHSPGLIRHLPPEAIKVFYETADGSFGVVPETHPYAAFNRLGAAVPNQIRILVEDVLAKRIVELALLELSEDERALFKVLFLPGGASSYFAHRIPTLMHDPNPIYLLLDGDQKPEEPYPDPATIPESENGTLESRIKMLTGASEVSLVPDGGKDINIEKKRTALRREYMGFLHSRVHFLPGLCPEDIVLRAIDARASFKSSTEAKEALKSKVRAATGVDGSDDITNFGWARLASQRTDNGDLRAISAKLRQFLAEDKPL